MESKLTFTLPHGTHNAINKSLRKIVSRQALLRCCSFLLLMITVCSAIYFFKIEFLYVSIINLINTIDAQPLVLLVFFVVFSIAFFIHYRASCKWRFLQDEAKSVEVGFSSKKRLLTFNDQYSETKYQISVDSILPLPIVQTNDYFGILVECPHHKENIVYIIPFNFFVEIMNAAGIAL